MPTTHPESHAGHDDPEDEGNSPSGIDISADHERNPGCGERPGCECPAGHDRCDAAGSSRGPDRNCHRPDERRVRYVVAQREDEHCCQNAESADDDAYSHPRDEAARSRLKLASRRLLEVVAEFHSHSIYLHSARDN